MTAAAIAEPRHTPEFRATIYYFVQFMAGASVTVYSGIWFAERGLKAGGRGTGLPQPRGRPGM